MFSYYFFSFFLDMPFSVGEYTEKRDKDFRIICLTVDKYQPTTRISFPLLYIWEKNQSINHLYFNRRSEANISGTQNHNRSNKLFNFEAMQQSQSPGSDVSTTIQFETEPPKPAADACRPPVGNKLLEEITPDILLLFQYLDVGSVLALNYVLFRV